MSTDRDKDRKRRRRQEHKRQRADRQAAGDLGVPPPGRPWPRCSVCGQPVIYIAATLESARQAGKPVVHICDACLAEGRSPSPPAEPVHQHLYQEAQMVSPDRCHDCGARPGQLHKEGCDVERCPGCGFQRITCGCTDDDIRGLPRQAWTGEWPGWAECREFGWYAKLVPGRGWVPCDPDEPGARPNVNRLLTEATWDRKRGRFVLAGPGKEDV
jgi:hypothetical protein